MYLNLVVIHPLSHLILLLYFLLNIPLKFLYPYSNICSCAHIPCPFFCQSQSDTCFSSSRPGPICWLYPNSITLGWWKGRQRNVGRFQRYSGNRIERIEWFGTGFREQGMAKMTWKCLAFVADWMLVRFTDSSCLRENSDIYNLECPSHILFM